MNPLLELSRLKGAEFLAAGLPDDVSLKLAHEMIKRGEILPAKQVLDAIYTKGGFDHFDYLTVLAGWHQKQLRHAEAIERLDVAVTFRPLDYTVHYNRAFNLMRLGRWDEARAALEMCLKLNPDFAMGWTKLGFIELATQHFAIALAAYLYAVLLDDADPEAHAGYGTALQQFGCDDDAIREYRRALEIDPDMYEAECGLGFTLLRAGQWEEGWERFAARWKLHPHGAPWTHQPTPFWRGKREELRGKRVLLRGEQGYGDTIHFCRYVPLVKALGCDVWLQTEPALERLMQSFGVPVIVRGRDALPVVDIDTTLMALPETFGTRPDDAPPPARFMVVEPKESGAKVGLCWHGGARHDDPPAHIDDLRRSIPWDQFLPIAEVVPCISLQQEDLDCEDWLDTARVIAGLDLVITVDTAVAHLAGSLGVETLCLLRAGGCFRWLSKGEQTVWYPKMKLYRQPVLAEWAPVIAQIVADLKARYA